MSRLRSTTPTIDTYIKLAQYPILSDKIRHRMRQEMFAYGIITEEEFEREIEKFIPEKDLEFLKEEKIAAFINKNILEGPRILTAQEVALVKRTYGLRSVYLMSLRLHELYSKRSEFTKKVLRGFNQLLYKPVYKTLKKTFIKDQNNVPSQKDLDKLNTTCGLLRSYSYLVPSGADCFEISSDMSGLEDSVNITLEPRLTIGKNIDKYYKQYKKSLKAYTLGSKRIAQLSQEISSLESDIALLSSGLITDIDVENILNKYKISFTSPMSSCDKMRGSLKPIAKPYKIFVSETGAEILVGKGSEANDEMTKNAKSNDYWFHVVGSTGSHVIISAEKNWRQSIPENLIREASILAIHYSKLKKDQAAEVYFTRKEHLKKKKGMTAGLWSIAKSETIFVKYSTEELQNIIQRQLL